MYEDDFVKIVDFYFDIVYTCFCSKVVSSLTKRRFVPIDYRLDRRPFTAKNAGSIPRRGAKCVSGKVKELRQTVNLLPSC